MGLCSIHYSKSINNKKHKQIHIHQYTYKHLYAHIHTHAYKQFHICIYIHMNNTTIYRQGVHVCDALFKSHCEYSPKNHSNLDSCPQRFILMNIFFELFDIN